VEEAWLWSFEFVKQIYEEPRKNLYDNFYSKVWQLDIAVYSPYRE